MKAIDGMGFTEMTEIQAKAIPKLLEGRDLRGTAKTGAGKTLAFVIPAVELIHKLKFKPRNGKYGYRFIVTPMIIGHFMCDTIEMRAQEEVYAANNHKWHTSTVGHFHINLCPGKEQALFILIN